MRRSTLDEYFNSYFASQSNKNITTSSRVFEINEFLKEGLSEKDLIKLKETFDSFDIDKSGFISPIKLRGAFKNFANLSVTKETIYHLICEFDNDENGELTFNDFVKLASPLYNQQVVSRNEAKSVFKFFDKENKGYITLEDLKGLGAEFNDIFGREEVEEVILNCAGDGKQIVFEDFFSIMNSKAY